VAGFIPVKIFKWKNVFSVSSVSLWLYLCVAGIFMSVWFSEPVAAKEDVASVVAIRNKAVIARDNKEMEAKVKDIILLRDAIQTLDASRAKILFIDDSVLTLGEKSKVIIREFVYSKEKGGKSIFNMIDGKMRSIVGKTEFEVHTPTAVAAARGTAILFETGAKKGRVFTTIICLEGVVDVRGIDGGIRDAMTLGPGMMTTIFMDDHTVRTSAAPSAEIDRLKRETDTSTREISLPPPPAEVKPEIPVPYVEPVPDPEPPIDLPPVQSTPVNINVIFKTPVKIDVGFP
jgi:hypothetical protein